MNPRAFLNGSITFPPKYSLLEANLKKLCNCGTWHTTFTAIPKPPPPAQKPGNHEIHKHNPPTHPPYPLHNHGLAKQPALPREGTYANLPSPTRHIFPKH